MRVVWQNCLMYVPSRYAMTDTEAWSAVADIGAGFLVVSSAEGLRSVFVPVAVDDDRQRIFAHVARGNSWWSSARDGDQVTALFNRAHAYVSPNYYPSKVADPRVAPTWNYQVVEVVGHVTVRDDPAFTESVVRRLTANFESTQSEPWRVDDAPPEFVSALVRGIVAFEIEVTSITGSAKLSQNQPTENQERVRQELSQRGDSARTVSQLMGEL